MNCILKLVNFNQHVYDGECYLLGVSISGDGAVGDCDVYDGKNNTEERKLHLEVPSGETTPLVPGTVVKMARGIYVTVNAVTTFAMVVYSPKE